MGSALPRNAVNFASFCLQSRFECKLDHKKVRHHMQAGSGSDSSHLQLFTAAFCRSSCLGQPHFCNKNVRMSHDGIAKRPCCSIMLPQSQRPQLSVTGHLRIRRPRQRSPFWLTCLWTQAFYSWHYFPKNPSTVHVRTPVPKLNLGIVVGPGSLHGQ